MTQNSLVCDVCGETATWEGDVTPDAILATWTPSAWDGLGRSWEPVCPAHRVELCEDGEYQFIEQEGAAMGMHFVWSGTVLNGLDQDAGVRAAREVFEAEGITPHYAYAQYLLDDDDPDRDTNAALTWYQAERKAILAATIGWDTIPDNLNLEID